MNVHRVGNAPPGLAYEPSALVGVLDPVVRDAVIGALPPSARVTLADDGRALFWRYVRAPRAFDIVVADTELAVYSGLDVAEAWRTQGAMPTMVLLSRTFQVDEVVRAYELGITLVPSSVDGALAAGRAVRNHHGQRH